MPGLFAALVAGLALCASAQEADAPAPFISTPDEVVERMLVMAGTSADDTVVDLGAGDGRIVIAAARRFGARGIGIDFDPRLVETARRNAERAGVSATTRFLRGDVLTADLSQATVVTAYLLPDLMWKLRARFMVELAPGTRVVSHAFDMPGWRPDRTETVHVASPHPGQSETSRLFLWIVPADVRGEWRSGEERLRIVQSYQQIEVAGASRAELRGRQISWQAPGSRFQGRVEGDRIVGRLQTGSVSRAVSFVRLP